MFGDLD